MLGTKWQDSWNSQSALTRIAVSVAFALALTLTSYLFVTGAPSLLSIRAWLYEFYETREQLQAALTTAVIAYVVLAQVCVALLCISARSRAQASGTTPDFKTADNFGCWTVLSVLLFSAVLGLSWLRKEDLSGPNASNWVAVGATVIAVVISFLLIAAPIINTPDKRLKNPVYSFAVGKSLVCLGFFLFAASAFHFSLLMGMFLLDYLLLPIGEPDTASSGQTPDPKASTAPRLDKEV